MNRAYENEAADFCKGIRQLAEHPESLDNFETFLSYHFAAWMEKYADTPAKLAAELIIFAAME